MLRFFRLFLVVLALLSAFPAIAAVRLFDFTARIDQPNALFDTGTVFSGSFSYEDSLAPSQVFPTQTGLVAIYDNPTTMIAATIGGQLFESGGLAALTDEAPGGDGDSFSVFNISGPYILSFQFTDPSGTGFTSLQLPTAFPANLWQGPFVDPNDDDELTVPSAEFSFYDVGRSAGFGAVVLSISPASTVPEPGTWVTMILGFGVAGLAMRRRRERAVLI